MATIKSIELENLRQSVQNSYGGRVRVYTANFDLSKTAIKVGDVLELCVKPQGGVFLGATVNCETSLGTSTVTIDGQSKDGKKAPVALAEKYAAASTDTTPNKPIWLGKSGVGEQTAFPELITSTIGGADLPATGSLTMQVFVGCL